MAKTESTAVNELIELVQTQTPLATDPSEDVLFREPPKVKLSTPRMTSTVPPIRGAGEVAPLPRTRAPQGTQRGVPAVMPPVPPVRMSTAPQRTATIPPLGAGEMKRPSVPPPIPGSIPPIPSALSPAAMNAAEPSDSMIATTQDLRSQLRQSSPKATMMGQGSLLPPLPPPMALPSPKATMMGHGSPLPANLPVVSQAARTTAPHMMPVAAPFASKPSAPMTLPQPGAPVGYPSVAPYLAHVPADMTSNQEWFDQVGAVEPVEAIEHEIGTHRVPKTSHWKALVPVLIAPTIVLIIIGVFVGGFFAFDGDGGYKPQPEKAKPAAPAVKAALPTDEAKAEPAAKADEAKADEPAAKAEEPKAEEPKAEAKTEPKTEPKADEPSKSIGAAIEAKGEPVAKVEPKAEASREPAPITPPNLIGTKAEPAVAAPTKVSLVDVRIDSKPSGATVMLVDRGKTQFLGTTPISTAVDPSRKYDLVFTYPNKATQIEHLDPATTKKVAIVLGKAAKTETPKVEKAAKTETPKVEKAVKVEAPKPAKVETPKIEKKVEAPKIEKAAKVEKTDKIEAAPAETLEKKSEPVGEGVLMISSKPPCEIYIDGTPTGLVTPQRSIKLPAGKHKVTLVNTAEKIKKTIAIQVTADQPTKVIQDLMK